MKFKRNTVIFIMTSIVTILPCATSLASESSAEKQSTSDKKPAGIPYILFSEKDAPGFLVIRSSDERAAVSYIDTDGDNNPDMIEYFKYDLNGNQIYDIYDCGIDGVPEMRLNSQKELLELFIDGHWSEYIPDRSYKPKIGTASKELIKGVGTINNQRVKVTIVNGCYEAQPLYKSMGSD